MAAASDRLRPNWLLRGLLLASALFHLGLILHVTGAFRVDAYTKIEVGLTSPRPAARALPRPRFRPPEPVEPEEVKPREPQRAAMPIPQMRELVTAPARPGEAGVALPAPPAVAALPVGGLLPPASAPRLAGADLEAYQEMLRARVERVKRYPPAAKRRHEEGRVTLHFSLGPDGRLLELKVAASSRSPDLDQAALEAVRRAAPYPPLPAELARKGRLALALTIAFELS